MASVAEVIPSHLLRPERKAEVIAWLRASALPRRFKRRLLQEWGEAVGVELKGEDYQKVLGT